MNAEDATCKAIPRGPWLSSLLALRGMQMASAKNKRRGEKIRRRRIDLLNSITLNLLTERRNGETRLNKSDWTMGHIKYLWYISRGVKRLIPKNRIAGRFCKYSKILRTVGFAFMFWKSTHQRWPAWFSRNSFIKGIASRITTESFIDPSFSLF